MSVTDDLLAEAHGADCLREARMLPVCRDVSGPVRRWCDACIMKGLADALEKERLRAREAEARRERIQELELRALAGGLDETNSDLIDAELQAERERADRERLQAALRVIADKQMGTVFRDAVELADAIRTARKALEESP